jgi:Putative zinc-finger
MHPTTPSSSAWEDCPEGTLQRLARPSRHRRLLKRAAWSIPLTLVMLLLLARSGWLLDSINWNSTTLTCDQVVKLLPAYVSDSLSATQRSQVDTHLKKCLLCAAKLKTIRAAQSVAKLQLRGTRIRFSERTLDMKLVTYRDPPNQLVATYRSELPFVAAR